MRCKEDVKRRKRSVRKNEKTLCNAHKMTRNTGEFVDKIVKTYHNVIELYFD